MASSSSSRVEALPDDFDDKINLNEPPTGTQNGPSPPPPAADGALSFDAMMAQAATAFPAKKNTTSNDDSSKPKVPGAAMPPVMENVRQYTADEILNMMNKTPLFMTELDETDEDGNENIALEALKALAYEGTRAENASSFREQGNEMARAKRWVDAREFYNKAIGALKLPQKPQDPEEGQADVELVELDEEEEAKKEKEIEEACYTNRALCNLEMKNYGSCNRDCASTLRLNPLNVKAYYRSASACLSLDKTVQARDACDRGLKIDPTNKPLLALSTKITTRAKKLAELEAWRAEREAKHRREQNTLTHALTSRNIPIRSTTDDPPQLEDATLHLSDPMDAASTLCIPALLLYPLHDQTDFIKSFAEDESVGQHLSYIFPLPWDEDGVYTPENVDCYIETTTGGLVKAGKKMALLRILNTGKCDIVDSLLRINVVPRDKAPQWIESFKRIKAAGKQ